MKRYLLLLGVLLVLVSSFMVASTKEVHAATSKCVLSSGTNTLHGQLDGAFYTIDVPSNWNGTLVLYSHGYVPVSVPLLSPAPDAPDAQMAGALLQEGYALAGSSYSQNGWALQQAFPDQIDVLNFFNETCGHPTRTIAWGTSLGGIITGGLVQLHPERFAGALPMCGVVDGGIAQFNVMLDSMFAFNVLLANSQLQLVHLTNPIGTLNQAESILSTAQKTAQGRARIALSNALEDRIGWVTPGSPEPAPNDFVTQEQNQFILDQQFMVFHFPVRAEMEGRAGGNPSWSTGVDYADQLEHSVDYREVVALYKQAGLSFKQDLKTLENAPRISADPQAVNYMTRYIAFNGDLDMPVLTLHTIGDGLVFNQVEQTYASVVRSEGDANLLRQVFVNRAGHCAFTDAEMITAFHTLIKRINTGGWNDSTDPVLMNQEAAQLGPGLNSFPPAFRRYQPTVFLRPFSVSDD